MPLHVELKWNVVQARVIAGPRGHEDSHLFRRICIAILTADNNKRRRGGNRNVAAPSRCVARCRGGGAAPPRGATWIFRGRSVPRDRIIIDLANDDVRSYCDTDRLVVIERKV